MIEVWDCELRDGTRAYVPCFVFDIENREVIQGDALGCQEFRYGRARDRFVAS